MIKELNDSQLLTEIKKLVKEEKRMTQLVLDYLSEVETRRLFALRGYPSLFEFCVRELGYSESSAFRRISAMRAIKSIPEAKSKLEKGDVNLSTLAQLQSFIKKEEKSTGVKLDLVTKRDLLQKIENKSQNECEKEFAKISPELIKAKESERPVTENLTEIKFMASNELMEKLKDLKNILSHKDVQSMAKLIETMADLTLEKIKKAKGVAPGARQNRKEEDKTKSTFAAEVKPSESQKPSRYIAAKTRHRVWQRDNGECQYVDPVTNRKCQSRFQIQLDHIIPLAKGGAAFEDNLRLLCFVHNQIEAINHFSKKHMEHYVPSLQ
jgi:5-methylcytosine-specific restriction endonuclease McrA